MSPPPLRRSAKGNQGRRAKANYPIPIGGARRKRNYRDPPPRAKPKKRRKSPFFPKKKPPRRSAHPYSAAFHCTPPYFAVRHPVLRYTSPHTATPHAAAFCCILLHTAPTSPHTAAHRSTPPCSAKSLRRAPAGAGKMRKKTGGGEKNERSESEKSGTIGIPPAQSQKKEAQKPVFSPKKAAATLRTHRTPHTAHRRVLLHSVAHRRTLLHTAAHRSTPPCSAKSLRRAPAGAGKMRKKTGGGEKKRKKRKRKKTAPNETPGRPPNPASLLRNQISRNAASAYSAGKIKNVWLIRTKKL